MGWIWALAAIVALLWPARTAGPFDGMPLDEPAKAILVGVVVPTLIWLHPRFLRNRISRYAIVVLLIWKACAVITLAPAGWCVRFEPTRPIVADATSPVPHSWDVRADWLNPQPACSAVMRRAYTGIGEFPVWFFNLPPTTNDLNPSKEDRPPAARTMMTVTGFLEAPAPGDMRIVTGDDMKGHTNLYVDGQPIADIARMAAGTHRIHLDAMLIGSAWRFEPTWNGADLWSSSALATTRRTSPADRLAHRAGRELITMVVLAWIAAWTTSYLASIGSPIVISWLVGVSVYFVVLVAIDFKGIAVWSVPALAVAVLLPVPTRLRNLTGVCALIAVPWLTLIAAWGAGDIGRFWFYQAGGNDHWGFQRNAYRIFMQGYWLEGGSRVFYKQPLYRWIAGSLHLVFGDSSVGERYWDGACILAAALLAWRVTKGYAGFRAGLLAMVLTLSVVVLGTSWQWVGFGLSEISSAGFLYLAAYVALRARRGSWAIAAAAGVLATLGFYTRLNSLPMSVCVAAFALPAGMTVRDLARRLPWSHGIAWRSMLTIIVTISIGVFFFAWRTWHYTGVFSVLYGTSRSDLAIWRPEVTPIESLKRGVESAMMVVALNDPPQFDWRALPVLAGTAAASLALLRVPRFRDLPAAPTLFLLACLGPAFFFRGFAYPGRFSIPIIGVACALAVCSVSALMRRRPAGAPSDRRHTYR